MIQCLYCKKPTTECVDNACLKPVRIAEATDSMKYISNCLWWMEQNINNKRLYLDYKNRALANLDVVKNKIENL